MLVNEDEYFRGQVEGDILYGVEGPPGPAGKSAYAYAKENGYTGSESVFSRLLGQFPERIDTAVQSAETAADAAYRAIEDLGNTGISIVNTDSGEVISLNDSAERPLMGMKVYGKTTQNGTPTPEAPVPLDSVGADGSVAVTVCGKNLLNVTESGTTTSDITFKVNSDKSITANGTSKSYAADFEFVPKTNMQTLPAGRYVFSGCPAGGSESKYCLLLGRMKDGAYSRIATDLGNGATFTLTEAENVYAVCRVGASQTVSDLQFYPMIRFEGTNATYEPYKSQILSIPTPNGLPGIPVTSGGNYTDENGQQWICDEVDFEKGVYVQRIAQHHLDGTENVVLHSVNNGLARFNYNELKAKPKGASMCNRLQKYGTVNANAYEIHSADGYVIFWMNIATTLDGWRAWLASNPVDLLLELPTPVETALSAEQLAAFAALHTNYPNTTIFNDEGADMEVKYVADTKLYIDKKFDQLAAAMLNN